MLLDYFLQLDDIKGDSTDAAYTDLISINTFHWLVQNASPVTYSGGSGAGKTVLGDMVVTKQVDIASIPLALVCATGQHLKKAVLRVIAQGYGPRYDITLTDVLVASVTQHGQSSDNVIMETIQLSYEKIEWSYYQQDNKGQVTQTITGGYDVKKQRKI